MQMYYHTHLRTTTVRRLMYVSGACGTVLRTAVDSVTRVVGLYKVLSCRINLKKICNEGLGHLPDKGGTSLRICVERKKK